MGMPLISFLTDFFSKNLFQNKTITNIQQPSDIELLEVAVNNRIHNNNLPSVDELSQNLTLNTGLNDVSSTGTTMSYVRSMLQHTIPDTRLFYPEPFLASPSYMHSDISFLHILQYWYWLWFLFIFLIIYFFLAFLSTLR